MPTREQVERSREIAERAVQQYRGRMQITYVLPDYYEPFPKACYGGWGKLYLVVTPNGNVLPCHGATGITTLQFDNVANPLPRLDLARVRLRSVPSGATAG